MMFNIFFLRRQIPFVILVCFITGLIIYYENYYNGIGGVSSNNNVLLENMLYIFLSDSGLPFPDEIKESINNEVYLRNINSFFIDFFFSRDGYNKHYKYYKQHPLTTHQYLSRILTKEYVNLFVKDMKYRPEYVKVMMTDLKIEINKLTVHLYKRYLSCFLIDVQTRDEHITTMFRRLDKLRHYYYRLHAPFDRIRRYSDVDSKKIFDLNAEVSKAASALTERMPNELFKRQANKFKEANKRGLFIKKYRKLWMYQNKKIFFESYKASLRKKRIHYILMTRSFTHTFETKDLLYRMLYRVKFYQKHGIKYRWYKDFIHKARGFRPIATKGTGQRLSRRDKYFW